MAELSAYEQQRLDNIARNDAKLLALGLGPSDKKIIGLTVKPRSTGPKRPRASEPRVGARRSNRARSTPVTLYPSGGASDDDDADETFVVDDSVEDYDELPPPKRRQRRQQSAPDDDGAPGADGSSACSKTPLTTTAAPPATAAAPTATASFLTVERAKTGRSSCRACRAPIAQGAHRVGMTAWIVGRQAMTWQCPACLVGGLSARVELTGRGRCKVTGWPLAKGAPKLGVTSHSATAWLSLAAAPKALAPVLACLGSTRAAAAALAAATGLDNGGDGGALPPDAAVALRAALLREAERKLDGGAAAAAGDAPDGADVARDAPPAAAASADAATDASQPARGRRTGATGRVCWRFGGFLCYGALLPASETETQCFARTHKGNTKTLAKGKDYWWRVEATADA